MNSIEIINKALSIPRIASRVAELKINTEQLQEARIILLQIIEESELKVEPIYLSTFIVASDGSLKLTKELSERGKELAISSNIVTQDLSPVNLDVNFKDMEQTKERIKFALYFKQYKQQVQEEGVHPKGFFLYGEMGIGKSFIAQAMVNSLAKDGQKVAFLNVAELVSIMKSKFKTGTESFVEKLKNVDNLFLDDIGAETITTWFRDDILLGILSARMNNNKTTFFTSNYSFEHLEKIESRTHGSKYPDKAKSARLLERVRALSIEVNIGGHNRRY